MTAHATTRWAMAAMLVAVLSGCQPASNPTASAPSPGTTVRLDDEGCGLEGNFTLTAGTIQIRVVNETGDLFSVELLEPSAEGTYDDIVAHFEQVQAAVDSGETLPTLPPGMREVARLQVEAELEADLEQPMGAGSYAIVCERILAPDDLFRVVVLGPIEVTESQ